MTKALQADRVEHKLAALLTEGPVTSKEGFREYRKIDYNLRKLKKTNPVLYRSKVNAVVIALFGLKCEVVDEDIKLEWGLSAVKREYERQRKKT